MADAFQVIIREEGPRALWRGSLFSYMKVRCRPEGGNAVPEVALWHSSRGGASSHHRLNSSVTGMLCSVYMLLCSHCVIGDTTHKLSQRGAHSRAGFCLHT